MENQTLEMFSSSTEVAKLFEALSKAQAEMKPAVMDMKNPHFNSKYASLTACQDAYRAQLAKFSLTLTQQIFSTDDKFYIRSMLGHSSGQWISNVFRLLIDRQNMQGLGSAITYGRRYGANALIGIVDTEDDDGNAASATQHPKPAPPAPTKQMQGLFKDGKPVDTSKGHGNLPSATVSEAQLKRMFAISHEAGWTHEQIKLYMAAAWGLESSKDLDRVKYDQLISVMQAGPYVKAIIGVGANNG